MNERVELVREAYETAAREGYLATDWNWFFERVAHEDIELSPSEGYIDTQDTYSGREGWSAFWQAFAQAWKSWTLEVDDLYEARDGLVVALMRVIAEGHESGITSDRKETHAWWFRGERVYKIVAWPDRDEAARELGLSM